MNECPDGGLVGRVVVDERELPQERDFLIGWDSEVDEPARSECGGIGRERERGVHGICEPGEGSHVGEAAPDSRFAREPAVADHADEEFIIARGGEGIEDSATRFGVAERDVDEWR